jgi:hypothetical protein
MGITEPGSAAWSDESFQEKDESGFYIIAAAIVEADAADEARDAMRALRSSKRSTGKLHWSEMDHRQRQRAANTVATLGGVHLVAIGSPVPPRRQERARRKCLSELIRELHGFDVRYLHMESREPALNERDIATIVHSRRYLLPKGEGFRLDHIHGQAEPLLWIADVVAGACRLQQQGQAIYRETLGRNVMDIEVSTDC